MNRRALIAVLALCFAALALWTFSWVLLRAPCWALILPVACVAWPVWFGMREDALFHRRLALGALTRPDSFIRRWFWSGRLASFVQLLAGLAWAAVLLLLIPLLGPWHLLLLALDALLLAAAARWSEALLASEIQAEHVGVLSRRWMLGAGNVAFIAAGFFAIDFFTGTADSRGQAWSTVADLAFGQFEGSAGCPLIATMLGALNAADRLTWHLAQGLVPALPGGYRGMAWLLLLLQAGLAGFAYTRFQLGVLALVATRSVPAAGGRRDRILPLALAFLVPAFMLLSLGLRDFDPARVRPALLGITQTLDPCGPASRQVAALRTGIGAEIGSRKLALHARLTQRARQDLGEVFDAAEAGVDSYLDWYFSLTGQYQRLGALVASRSIEGISARIDARLEAAVFSGPRIAERLADAHAQIATDLQQEIRQMASEVGRQLDFSDATACWNDLVHFDAVAPAQRDIRAAGVSAAAGIAGALVTRAAAAGLSRAVIARLAASPAYRGAGSVLMRLLGRRAGSLLVGGGTGAAVCAPGGPLALLCSLAAGGAAWITVDKVQIEIDERRYREAMRTEILEALRLQEVQQVQELIGAQGAVIDTAASELQAAVDRIFIPARDG